MLSGLDRMLFGRQAERVPAHRVQHVVAAHAPGARDDVGGGVPLGMTDVQTDARRVGEHVEDVALGPSAPARRPERPVLVPVALPASLDLEVVVSHILLYPAPIRIPTCISHSPGLRVLAARGFSRHARRAAQYPIRSSSGPLAIDDRDRTPRLPGALYHPGTRPGHLCRATDPLGTGGCGEDTRDNEQERGGLRYRGRHEALTGPALGECVRPGDRVAGRGDSFHAR